MTQKRLLILGTCIGSALEYYDFVIFMIFSSYIGATFFPQSSPFASKFQTLSLFAAGYLARPIGGLIFGHLGDKYGRKACFTASMIVMALSTLSIGLLPGYAQLGELAAILLCLLRILQGFAQGAELPGALTFISEHCSSNERGWRCGLITMGVGFGASFSGLVSTVLVSHFTSQQMVNFAWRIPFLLGGSIAVIGYLIRKNTQETPAFLAQTKPPTVPLLVLLQSHPKTLLRGICICLFAACFIIFALYLPTYLHEYFHYETKEVMLSFTIATTLCSLLIPLFGLLSDRIGRYRQLYWASILAIAALFPMFKLVSAGTPTALYTFMFIFEIIISLFAACYPALLADIFPTAVRYSGVAFCYNASFSIAGMMPLFASFILHNTASPYSIVVPFVILATLTSLVTRRAH